MNKKLEFKDSFLSEFENFENSLNGEISSGFHSVRKTSLDEFTKIPLPTNKDEEWKYTNLAPLFKHNFKYPTGKAEAKEATINKFLFDELEHHLIVFVNGIFSKELSRLNELPSGVVVNSIAEEFSKNNPIIPKYLGKFAKLENQLFTSLSTAFTRDGAFVYVPENKIVEDAVHIIFLTTGKDKIFTQPRNLFVAEKNSQITVIEHYVSDSDKAYFTNSVTEIATGENAVVDHIRLQEESIKSFHIARMEVEQEKNSNFSSHLISTGAEISRNDFNVKFNDSGCESTLNGLYMINGNQLFDAHTLIDHAKPHCNSHEHYKGILEQSSKGVFNGKVMVRQDAQKTNAFQQNNNILLSNDAVVNTKPQLEIFADDVKCSHGATIGKLNEESMFYLKSRGIGEEAATAMLIHAFASDVITSIKIPALREYLEKIITQRYNQ